MGKKPTSKKSKDTSKKTQGTGTMAVNSMRQGKGTAAIPGTPEQTTPNQSLGTGLTPDQSLTYFTKLQEYADKLQETDWSNQDAQTQHDKAAVDLNTAAARQSQTATSELIARGMLQSGTAAGALSDIQVAASKQREALNQALLQTQIRNNAVRTNIMTRDIPFLSDMAHRQMGENIATGVVPGSFTTKPATPGSPAGAPATPTPAQLAAQKVAANSKSPTGASPPAAPKTQTLGPNGTVKITQMKTAPNNAGMKGSPRAESLYRKAAKAAGKRDKAGRPLGS